MMLENHKIYTITINELNDNHHKWIKFNNQFTICEPNDNIIDDLIEYIEENKNWFLDVLHQGSKQNNHQLQYWEYLRNIWLANYCSYGKGHEVTVNSFDLYHREITDCQLEYVTEFQLDFLLQKN